MPNQSARKARDPVEPVRSRFELKRGRILDAATTLINERGVVGTTLAEVAQTVDLNTTGVTYYFKRKDQLAAAVFDHTLMRIEAMAMKASLEPTPIARVTRFIEQHFEILAKSREGEDRALALLSDIRALDDDARVNLERHYQEVFRLIRNFFGTSSDPGRKTLMTARAHMLTEVVFWLPAWTDQYETSDFPRLRNKVIEVLAEGILPPGIQLSSFDDALTDGSASGRAIDRDAYLRSATRLINDLGYRGASVDRIVADLKISKGSFYHHLDAKDDLVFECFRRSYDRIRQAQDTAAKRGGQHGSRLALMFTMLLDIQFRGTWPLLRTTALQALPPDVRSHIVDQSNRTALRIAGTLVDGMADGSVRMLDPMVTSQMIMATINAAYDLRHWAGRLPRDEAISIYASTLMRGLFD